MPHAPGSFFVVRWFPRWRVPHWKPVAGLTMFTPRVFRSARAAERVALKVQRKVGGVVAVLGPVDDFAVAIDQLPAPCPVIVEAMGGRDGSH